jgi:hypothetical protein
MDRKIKNIRKLYHGPKVKQSNALLMPPGVGLDFNFIALVPYGTCPVLVHFKSGIPAAIIIDFFYCD